MKEEVLENDYLYNSIIEDEDTIDKSSLILQLTKGVFWNCDLEKLDYIRDKDYIIKRIVETGTENDEIIMWKLYTYEEIKNVAINIEYLDKDVLTYMSFVLKINEEEFKCYGKKPFYKKC